MNMALWILMKSFEEGQWGKREKNGDNEPNPL
jgi:hypothetical protein